MSKRDEFDHQAQRIAKNLCHMAAEIEREVERDANPGESVQEIIHTINWGVANLNLDILVRRAMRATQETPK